MKTTIGWKHIQFLIICFITALFCGSVYAFSLVSSALQFQCKFSTDDIEILYSSGSIGQYVMIIPGALYDLFGPIICLIYGVLLAVCGTSFFSYFVYNASTQGCSVMLAAFAYFMTGQGSAAIFQAGLYTSLKTFPEYTHSGITGFLTAGYGISAAFLSLIFEYFFARSYNGNIKIENYFLFLALSLGCTAFLLYREILNIKESEKLLYHTSLIDTNEQLITTKLNDCILNPNNNMSSPPSSPNSINTLLPNKSLGVSKRPNISILCENSTSSSENTNIYQQETEHFETTPLCKNSTLVHSPITPPPITATTRQLTKASSLISISPKSLEIPIMPSSHYKTTELNTFEKRKTKSDMCKLKTEDSTILTLIPWSKTKYFYYVVAFCLIQGVCASMIGNLTIYVSAFGFSIEDVPFFVLIVSLGSCFGRLCYAILGYIWRNSLSRPAFFEMCCFIFLASQLIICFGSSSYLSFAVGLIGFVLGANFAIAPTFVIEAFDKTALATLQAIATTLIAITSFVFNHIISKNYNGVAERQLHKKAVELLNSNKFADIIAMNSKSSLDIVVAVAKSFGPETIGLSKNFSEVFKCEGKSCIKLSTFFFGCIGFIALFVNERLRKVHLREMGHKIKPIDQIV